MEKIKIIIADDNKPFCEFLNEYLSDFEDIEILGIAYSDEEEVNLIKEFKPDIVITDLVRNNDYTGLEIIQNYQKLNDAPAFLVISADDRNNPKFVNTRFDGYIKKPFIDYTIVVFELRNIMYKRKQERNQLVLNKTKEMQKDNIFIKILNYLKFKRV